MSLCLLRTHCPTQWDTLSSQAEVQRSVGALTRANKRLLQIYMQHTASGRRGVPITTSNWYSNQTAFSGASSCVLGLSLLASVKRL